MNRKKVYWLSQLSGWLIYAAVNIVLSSFFSVLTWERVVILFYICYTGISFTHIFRMIVKKNDWMKMPLKKMIPRVFLASILIGTVMYLLLLGMDLATGIFKLSRLQPGIPLAGIFQLSVIILLWALIYFSVHFFENYKKVEIESYIWEAAVKDFELKTLKSQLNPHFMFNALNSIRALIGVDPMGAQTAVTKLSNLLRYSLKMERIETVSLQEEIQTVSDYLALESIRFEERLRYQLDIDPKTANVEIPPMMIQTLVENGIKHGISKKTNGGEIFISSKLDNSKLVIIIRNTGQLNDEALQNSSGFGISNTKHRLHLLYGETASFTIKNISNTEVMAELVIPTGGRKYEVFNN